MIPTTMLAEAALKTSVSGKELPKQGRDEGQGEVAVHHRRDARQDLQDGLQDAPKALAGVFAQEDGREKADGKRDDGRSGGHLERSGQQGQHPEALGLDERGPAGAREELPDGDPGEEDHRLAEEDRHDAYGDECRQRGAGEEGHADRPLLEAAVPLQSEVHRDVGVGRPDAGRPRVAFLHRLVSRHRPQPRRWPPGLPGTGPRRGRGTPWRARARALPRA